MNKFNCIENHATDTDEKLLEYLDTYIKDYIHNKTPYIAYDFILQIKHFKNELLDNETFCNNLSKYIISFFSSEISHIRTDIKNNTFTLSKLITWINEIKIKFDFINEFFNCFHSVNQVILYHLENIIIFDPYVKSFIESHINIKQNNNHIMINKLISLLLTFSKHSSYVLHNKCILLIGRAYKDKISALEYNKVIPELAQIGIKFNEIINCINQLEGCYSKLNQPLKKILFGPLEQYFNKYFREIVLTKLDVYLINQLLGLCNTHAYLLAFPSEYKKEYSLLLYNKLNQYLIDNNNIIDITKITYYIKFIIKEYTFNNKLDIIHTIMSNETNINNLFKLLDMNILYFNSNIVASYSLLSWHTDIDIIMCKYKKHLIKRILYIYTQYNMDKSYVDINKYIIYERKILDAISCYPIAHPYTFPLKKILNDIEMCVKFNNTLEHPIFKKYQLVIPSYNWGLDTSEGLITLTTDMITSPLQFIMFEYEIVYTKYTEYKHRLYWMLHYGEVDITYLNINIKLLPIQYIILELFDKNDNITLDTIINIKMLNTYSYKTKMNIINSLVISKLLFSNNNIFTLNTEPTFNPDLISCYHTNYNADNILTEQLQYSRYEITSANINSIIKQKQYNMNELYSQVKTNIKQFQLNEDLFNNTIKTMLDKDYIAIENNIICKQL